MKKTVSILFLVVYLCSVTEAHQLLKIPVALEHFKEHRVLDKDISFLQFLAMHYLHSNANAIDYSRDMQLPFKADGDCVATIAPAYVPVMVELNLERPVETIQQQNFIKPDQSILSSYRATIWQPPKS